MMKDYKLIWEKWFLLINQDLQSRKKLLDSLHLETKKGFDVITRIATEELENRISQKEVFNKIKEDLESSIALCAWSGYLLFLTDSNIDPVKQNFVDQTSINELGNVWMKNYEEDKGTKLLTKIDPILSMFLEKVTQNELNKLFVIYPKLIDLPYKETGHIESFFNWASHQGFVISILEQQLINQNLHNKYA